MRANDEPDDELVFKLRSPVGTRAVLFIVGGVLALCFGAVVFLVQLLLPPEHALPVPAKIGLVVIPTMLGLAAFGYGLTLCRIVSRVVLDPDGVTVSSFRGTHTYQWEEVARVDDDKIEYPMVGLELDAITLYDRGGAKLATLTSQLRGFEDLADEVKRRVRGRSGVTGGHARARYNKPMALLFFAFALLMLFAARFVAHDTWYEATNSGLLETEGVVTEATIVKHEMFNVTPRVEYEFTDEAGVVHTRNTMMTQAEWNRLIGEPVVEVRYVRSNPEYSRLLVGEAEGGVPSVKAPWGYVVAVLAAGMSLFMLFIGALRWAGWDLDVGKDGVKWVRYGDAPQTVDSPADPDRGRR